jgi:beta-N-acetylhexosaminidase
MTQHAPLIIDVAGLTLTKQDRKRLKHPLVGGIILFARNWQNREQLSSLCADIKQVRKDLLICVDHEGGRVQRFKTDGFTHLPTMRTLGDLWMKDAMKATNAATACGYILASELRACGVDFSFTPVLDLDFGESSVIGDRSFHRDPRVAALLAKSLMHGLLQSGMANCGKHFPGHGFVKADSHTDIPLDKRSLKAILTVDAAPYNWLSSSLTSVMPAHVIYPKVDSRPAGFSSKWLGDILRGQCGFAGAIFSDDLSMQAARLIDDKRVSYTEAAVTALNAGCDMVLLCNQSVDGGEAVDELIDGIVQAVVKEQWLPCEASDLRRLALLPATPAPDWDALMVQPQYMQALSLLACLQFSANLSTSNTTVNPVHTGGNEAPCKCKVCKTLCHVHAL